MICLELEALKIQKSTVLQIPFNIAFAPFLFTIGFLFFYSTVVIVQNIRQLIQGEQSL
jgi:TRAP-type C4-dicarboxylate transport system permease small subunit